MTKHWMMTSHNPHSLHELLFVAGQLSAIDLDDQILTSHTLTWILYLKKLEVLHLALVVVVRYLGDVRQRVDVARVRGRLVLEWRRRGGGMLAREGRRDGKGMDMVVVMVVGEGFVVHDVREGERGPVVVVVHGRAPLRQVE